MPAFNNSNVNDIKQKELEKELRNLIDKIPFVFITEYFDESLVLLRRIMCWEIKDIIYTKLKLGSYNKYLFEDITHFRHLYWKNSQIDFALYELYNQTFWSLVQGQERFSEEVETFRSLNKKVNEFCSPLHEKLQNNYSDIWDIMKENKSFTISATQWNKDFTVTTEDCVLMVVNEEVIRNVIIAKQYPKVSQ